MDMILEELLAGVPDSQQIARIVIRLTAAAFLAALVGLQRERAGKSAGVRTHMLVGLGTALYVVTCLEAGMPISDVSRVVQGMATGIGFLGAGTIIKRADEHEISGLTTAAGIWMTAAVGAAAGMGRWGSATVSVVLALIILSVVGRVGQGRDGAAGGSRRN